MGKQAAFLVMLLAVGAFLLLVPGILADHCHGTDPGDTGSSSGPALIKVGAQAPNFKLKGPDGKQTELKQVLKQKKVVALWFGTGDCSHTADSAPGYQRMFTKFKNKGFGLLGVFSDAGSTQAVTAYAKEHKLTYPILVDSGGKATKSYGVRKTPTLVLISKNGKVLAVHEACTDKTAAAVTKQIQAALAAS